MILARDNRIDLCRASYVGGGLAPLPERGPRQPPAIERPGIVRCQPDYLIVITNRADMLPHLAVKIAAVQIANRKLRIELDGFIEIGQCTVRLQVISQRIGAVEIQDRELRAEPDRLIIIGNGFGQLLLSAVGNRAIVERAQEGRI